MSRRPGPTSRTPRVSDYYWCCSRRGLGRRGSVTMTATATTSRSTRGSGRRLLVNHLRLLRIEARLHAWYQWNTSHWNASHWYTGHRHTSHWHTTHWNASHWNASHWNTLHHWRTNHRRRHRSRMHHTFMHHTSWAGRYNDRLLRLHHRLTGLLNNNSRRCLRLGRASP